MVLVYQDSPKNVFNMSLIFHLSATSIYQIAFVGYFGPSDFVSIL